jgi:hypothetical protein
MGMTNRVIPAQGEERGASFSLIRLDGAAARKFQPPQQQFLGNFYNVLCGTIEARRAGSMANSALNRADVLAWGCAATQGCPSFGQRL